MTKIHTQEKKKIVSMSKYGFLVREIAEELDVSQGTVLRHRKLLKVGKKRDPFTDAKYVKNAKEIFKMYKQNYTYREIAEKFNGTVGGLCTFFSRYRKKNSFTDTKSNVILQRNKTIMALLKKGKTVKQISKLLKISSFPIYQVRRQSGLYKISSRLSAKEIQKILFLRKNKFKLKEISDLLGRSVKSIWKICSKYNHHLRRKSHS